MTGVDECRFAVGVRTDVGHVRTLNEDAVLTAAPVFAVADGMGGHAAGEVASRLVVERLATLAGRSDLRGDDLVDVLEQANADVLGYGAAHPDAAGMGTTVCGVCLGEVGGALHWYVFNVGDSRVYRYAAGALTQITVDHSEVQELVTAGQLTRGAARGHPLRNVVTRSLGTDPAPQVDLWMLPAEPGERFVVCSDGLTGDVPDVEILDILRSIVDPQAIADELLSRALVAGANDNVSLIVTGLLDDDGPPVTEVTAPRGRLNGVRSG